ncbi:MAG: septum formation initiator family protein [Rickettsiales bacterium]
MPHGKRQINKKTFATIFVTILIIYLIYHILTGNRGVISLFKLNKEKEVLHSEISHLEKQKTSCEKDVGMMKSSHINKDLLDEQVRKKLGYINKNEKTYSIKKTS